MAVYLTLDMVYGSWLSGTCKVGVIMQVTGMPD